MRMLLLRMLLLVMVMTPQGVQAQSTCTAVTEMKSRITYITCHFQKDASEYDFNVQFFSSDGSTQETALACNHQKSEELNCHKASGVEFNEHQKIRYYFTFARNAALSPAGSEYMCQRVPSEGGVTAERCKVGEIDIPEVPKPTSSPADTDGSGESPAVIILLVIIIVIVVAVGICGALAYVKRDRITKWWTKHTIGLLGPEDLNDPEKHTSRDPKMPEGWPAYFFNMGWREAMAGEGRDTGNKDKGKQSPQPSQEQPQSKDDKQDRERDDTLAEVHARQPLLPYRSWIPSRTTPQTAQLHTARCASFHGRDKTTHHVGTPVDKQPRSQSWNVREKDTRAGPIGASIQESPEAETFHDAPDFPVSPGGKATITPGKKEMERERKAQEKAEKDRVKKEKEDGEKRAKTTINNADKIAKQIEQQAKGKPKEETQKAKLQRAKEIIRSAEREAKRITEGAKGKPNEEKEKAKLKADRLRKEAREVAQHIKEGAGKGDNEGNQEATATV